MEVWIVALLLCVAAVTSFGASSSFCPEMCTCPSTSEAHCTSLQFAKKNHLTTNFKWLSSLDVSNISITKLNVNLNTLSNLKHLNLRWNKIQHISPPFLPRSLETLDLSHNYIKYFPRNLHMLPNLKEVRLGGNPIHCDCDSLSVLEDLTKYDVIVHSIKCEYPKKYKGVTLQSIQCQHVLFEDMQGDAQYEGSGSEDHEASKGQEIEGEFILPEVTSSSVVTEAVVVQEEGSGADTDDVTSIMEEYDDSSSPTTDEYDYGSIENATEVVESVIVPVQKSDLGSVFVKPCNFDCSTPLPIDTGNETGESPPPNLMDGLLIIANDLGIIDETKNTSTTQLPKNFDNETLQAETTVDNPADRAAITDNVLNTEEKSGKISAETEKQSQTSYIFLGVVVAGIIVVVLYVFVKRVVMRRNSRPIQQNGEDKNEPMEEIELLTKPPVDNGNKNGTPEVVPLINGNTDNKNSEVDDNVSAVKEPEPKNDEGVELRKPPRKNVPISSEMKRVTIKAGEIPNSTPKTPVLVTRHLNSDGDIVTTPNVN